MRVSTEFILLCCVLVIPEWTSSQGTDDCLTVKARNGKCVSIDNCPALRLLAYSVAISESDRRYLEAHSCGFRQVCCEASVEAITTTVVTDGDTSERIHLLEESLLPSGNDCGLDSAAQRIVGGAITDKEQYRWMVAIDYNTTKRQGVRCGGSLINTKYVLTAAHCVFSVKEQDITLRLGEWDLDQNPDCEEDDNQDCNPDVRIERVRRIIIHPAYRSKHNDIALLRMEQALPDGYTSHILPICLPHSDDLRKDSYTNRNVGVVGWGKNEQELRSRFKMFSELITISINECGDSLGQTISEQKLCAKTPSNTVREACPGDSGGPLQVQINGTYYLIGIVSHGPPCGVTLLPTIYTRVTAYMDWILDNIID